MSAVTLTDLERRGRLGNQMFQVAACVGIARRYDAGIWIPPNWSYRPWFSLPEAWYQRPKDTCTPADLTAAVEHIDPRARMYLQDLGLFSDVAEEIRSIFQPSVAAWRVLEADPAWGLANLDGAVALHVRRGDTVTQPAGFQPLATLDFYAGALDKVDPDAPIIVFSDDIPWCRQNLPGIGHDRWWNFVDHGDGRSHRPNLYRRQPAMDWLDIQLMTRCARHIISNSTYAWWGAWLARDPEALYPSVWWGPNLAHIDSDLMIPEGWVEVPC